MTVRRALYSESIDEGVYYAIPGKGIYVYEDKQPAESCPLMSFTEEMALRGNGHASSSVLAAPLTPASTVMASTLHVELDMRPIYLRRLRLADGFRTPQTDQLYQKLAAPQLARAELQDASLYNLLRQEYHLCLSSSKGTVEAVLADEEHASLLEIELPAALLVTEQISFLEDGQPLEYARTAYRGDRYQYRI